MNLVSKNKDVFGSSYSHLSQTNLVTLHIDTGDARPVYRRPNPHLSHAELKYLKEELTTMVDNGVLIPATHDKTNAWHRGWSFPCRYVQKKNGERRLVTQFQDLNKVTVRDPRPPDNITDLIEKLGGARAYSTLDLLKGFHQIAVEKESIPKLTIATPFGSYSYRVMPFGIQNGPSTFTCN